MAPQLQHMSSLSEQLPWQLRQQPVHLGESAEEQTDAVKEAADVESPAWPGLGVSETSPAVELDSMAQQQPQHQQQEVSLVHRLGEARDASNGMSTVTQAEQEDGESAARAAYRLWSASFEARRVGCCCCSHLARSHIRSAQDKECMELALLCDTQSSARSNGSKHLQALQY